MDKPRVLFLCNANSARSLVDEALLRHPAGDCFEAVSAGNEPDEPHWDIRDPRLIEHKDAYEQALAEIRQRLSLWLASKTRDDVKR